MATDSHLVYPWFNCSTTTISFCVPVPRIRPAQTFMRPIRRQRRLRNTWVVRLPATVSSIGPLAVVSASDARQAWTWILATWVAHFQTLTQIQRNVVDCWRRFRSISHRSPCAKTSESRRHCRALMDEARVVHTGLKTASPSIMHSFITT